MDGSVAAAGPSHAPPASPLNSTLDSPVDASAIGPAARRGAVRIRGADAVARIDDRLDALVPPDPDAPAMLVSAMRDALLAPGKRLRPLLAMAAAEHLGADPAAALDAGCALEMAHAASLALDDLPCMDDARLRRGRPALHAAFGEDVAILASIALLSRAFEVVAREPRLDASARATLGAALAEGIGSRGLAGGQLDDLRGAAERRDAEDAQRCNLRKTGALFVAAVEIGAAVAQARASQRESLRGYALHLGCAFQIRDDLIDATATTAQAGKDTGVDAARRTIVGLLGIDGAAREMRAHLAAARRAAASVAPRGAGGDAPLARFLQAAFGSVAARGRAA